LTSSGGKVTGTVRMLDRTPASPAVTQNEVPPRVEVIFGREIGVVEQKMRRLALHHRQVWQIRLRVAHQEVVDVVLAGIGAGGKRRPRRGRLGRMRGLEAMQPALRRQFREVGELAGRDPSLGELGIHAVETEDDELLLEALRRHAAGARACHDGEHDDAEKFPHARLFMILANYTFHVRVLGIDYGARRIGLALSDATATLASPWRLLQRPPSEAETLRVLINEIATLAADSDGLEAVVVGWPRRLDGSPTDQTPLVEAFARGLEAKIAVPVVLQDERLSSTEAESRLALREKDWRKRKLKLDAAAAAVILQDYLDGRPR